MSTPVVKRLPNLPTYGNRVKYLCGGKSICEMAKICGISYATFYNIVKGLYEPKISTLKRMCECSPVDENKERLFAWVITGNDYYPKIERPVVVAEKKEEKKGKEENVKIDGNVTVNISVSGDGCSITVSKK